MDIPYHVAECVVGTLLRMLLQHHGGDSSKVCCFDSFTLCSISRVSKSFRAACIHVLPMFLGKQHLQAALSLTPTYSQCLSIRMVQCYVSLSCLTYSDGFTPLVRVIAGVFQLVTPPPPLFTPTLDVLITFTLKGGSGTVRRASKKVDYVPFSTLTDSNFLQSNNEQPVPNTVPPPPPVGWKPRTLRQCSCRYQCGHESLWDVAWILPMFGCSTAWMCSPKCCNSTVRQLQHTLTALNIKLQAKNDEGLVSESQYNSVIPDIVL